MSSNSNVNDMDGDETLDVAFDAGEEEETTMQSYLTDVDDTSRTNKPEDEPIAVDNHHDDSNQPKPINKHLDNVTRKRRKHRRGSTYEIENGTGGKLSAAQLFVYKWPQDDPLAELWVLQEQISDFLEVKSFRRKYPDFDRRQIDMKEREYLKENKVVTETQCDLGLNALKLKEVLYLMDEKYPEKSKEFNDYLNEKRKLQAVNTPVKRKADPVQMTKDLLKKSIKAAAEYNLQLQREKKSERTTFFDLQTMRIQVPIKKKIDVKTRKPVSSYPVSLISGQYQNYYKKYTSDELNYLPINTTLYTLPTPDPLLYYEWKQNSNSIAVAKDESSDEETIEEKIQVPFNNGQINSAIKPETVSKQCYVCQKTSFIESMIHCSSCPRYSHPMCLELNPSLVDWVCIRNYDWQCMECKFCSTCNEPHDEDKMMFCDRCDRGFHTYCVGVKDVPIGSWICARCKTTDLMGSQSAIKNRHMSPAKRGRPVGSVNKKKFLNADHEFNDSLDQTPSKKSRGRPKKSEIFRRESNSNDMSMNQNDCSMDYDEYE